MPVIIELITSPAVDNSFFEMRSAELEYRVTGVDPSAAGATGSDQLQFYVEGLVYDKVITDFPRGFRHRGADTGWPFVGMRSRPDGLDWLVAAIFSRSAENGASFDIHTETRHVVRSKNTVDRYPEGAPDFHQMIGVVAGGEADGVDIVVPTRRFSESRIVPAPRITPAFQDTIDSLTGTINKTPFMGREKGELLFLGANGQRLPGGGYRVTYEFAFQPSSIVGGQGLRAPIEIQFASGPPAQIEKLGWDYLWVYYTRRVVGTPPVVVRVPISANVEAVYSLGEFSLLGLFP